MSADVLVSVIVPVYKVESYLDRCVKSILSQTYTNFELILVDDGSPDRCPAMCDEYQKQDARIRVIHKANGGLSDARNCGLDAAGGSYIMLVDSDDYIAPDMCEKLVNAVLKHSADMAVCNFNHVTIENKIEPEHVVVSSGVFSGREIIEKAIITWPVVWNRLYRRKLFENVRFPVGKLHEDDFVFFDLLHRSDRVVCIEDALYYYVHRESSIMSSFSVRRLDACEAYFIRADKMMRNGYSRKRVSKAVFLGLRILASVFDCGVYEDPVYRARYRELLHQYRKLGLIRLLRNVFPPLKKYAVILNYIDPKLIWKLRKILRARS